MIKSLVISLLFISCFANAELSVNQLREKGSEAYSNDDCIRAIKYLYAYQLMAESLSNNESESLDKVIGYCEELLGRYVASSSFYSGLSANRGVMMDSKGELQTFDVSTSGVLITAEGGLKTLNSGEGGVYVSTSGIMETINNTGGGVLISPDGTLSNTPKDIEYLIKGVNVKDDNDLGFILDKKKVEIENLERYKLLMDNRNINIE